jgi:hypothetical protein
MSESGPTARFSSFDPRNYLAEYYDRVGPENDGLLAFYARAYRTAGAGGQLLEVGGGPVIYPLLSAAAVVREIHFTDALQSNLDEVKRALEGSPDAFDWRPFTRRALEHERGALPSEAEVSDRLALVGSRVTKLLPLDVRRLAEASAGYDIVQANFVLDSITSTHDEWERLLRMLVDRVRPGGTLLMCALEGSRWWRIGDLQFPAVSLDADRLGRSLRAAGMVEIEVDRIPAETEDLEQGYSGILCARSIRARS